MKFPIPTDPPSIQNPGLKQGPFCLDNMLPIGRPPTPHPLPWTTDGLCRQTYYFLFRKISTTQVSTGELVGGEVGKGRTH